MAPKRTNLPSPSHRHARRRHTRRVATPSSSSHGCSRCPRLTPGATSRRRRCGSSRRCRVASARRRSRTCARPWPRLRKGHRDATAQQYVLRVKSLLSYGHKLGYMPFNAGVAIKIKPDQSRGQLAKRIMPEVDVKLLIRAARSRRDRVMLETLYAGGLRISELVGLSWADVIERDAKVQLSVTGKGGRTRQVLLPQVVSASLLALRGDAGANDPVFASHKGGRRLTERTVGYMLKRTAKRAGIADTVSPHWLRHAHGSHALDRGATLAEVQSTLGHANVATTSGYLHARPNTSSGLKLDEGIFR